jgi:integrase
VDLRGALRPFKTKHHAAILDPDPARLGELLRAIDGYNGSPLTVAALRLGLLTFVRPGELRHAKWVDIDLEARTWVYRVAKTQTDHIVPLSRQAREALDLFVG